MRKKVTEKKLPTNDIDRMFREAKAAADRRDDFDNEDRGFGSPVENYFILDFVAVPPNFNLDTFMGMREHVGLSKFKNVNLDEAKKIAMAIACSPVFATMNNHRINPATCLYVLMILNELGLVVKTIHNPLRMTGDSYERYIEEDSFYIRTQRAKRISFAIINICQIMSQEIIDDAFKIAQKAEIDQINLEKTLNSLGNLDNMELG